MPHLKIMRKTTIHFVRTTRLANQQVYPENEQKCDHLLCNDHSLSSFQAIPLKGKLIFPYNWNKYTSLEG
jgi:hypothetical protein